MPPVILQTIEQTGLSTWIRDSPSVFGFWLIISLHAIGMALLVGASTVVGLRVLGVASDLPLATLKRVYPIIWIGFWIQLVSGVLLLIGYPTKSLTAPVFYVKIALIGAAMVVVVKLGKKLPSTTSETPMRRQMTALAGWTLALWFGVITAGRPIAYTARYNTYP